MKCPKCKTEIPNAMQSAGGKARAAAMTPKQRAKAASKAANARWNKPDGKPNRGGNK